MNIPMNDLVSHLKENHIAILKLPTLLWAKFNKEDSPICKTKNWHTFKFICNNGQLNDDVEKISTEKGGIYVFSISPEIIPERQRILMYIGRAQITYNENLKQRIKSYYSNFCKGRNWKRPKIQQLFIYWKDYVYCSYFEMDDNNLIKSIEADLNEDDIIAIATRHLIETHPLFKEKRLNNHKQKAIRDNDATAFTNIISLYECNTELLKYYIRNDIIKDENKRQLKGKSKIDTYCRFRKSDDEISSFLSFVDNFWNSVTNNISSIHEYLEIDIDSSPAKQFRNQNGGILIFRPIGQKPFVINAVEAYDKLGDFDIVMRRLNEINWDITSDLWTYIAWNPVNKKMIASSNGRILYLMIKFLLNIVDLNDKEKADLASQYKAFKKDEVSSDTEVFNILSRYSLQKI